MPKTRWVEDPAPAAPAGTQTRTQTGTQTGPAIPNLEVTYLTDPEVVAEVLPKPLEAPPEPNVHVRICDINIQHGDFVHRERVGWFGVDAMWRGRMGEYPLLIPIDLEPALAISREKFGEPKKLAEIELSRDGDHVRGSITRQGVTFVEIIGDVAEKLPTPEPYENTQFWFKFLPAAVGNGLDAGPFLVTLDQVRTHQSREARRRQARAPRPARVSGGRPADPRDGVDLLERALRREHLQLPRRGWRSRRFRASRRHPVQVAQYQ